MEFPLGRKGRHGHIRLFSFGTSSLKTAVLSFEETGPARFLTVKVQEYPTLAWGIASVPGYVATPTKENVYVLGFDVPFLVPQGLRLTRYRSRPKEPCSQAELRTIENDFSWQIREYVRHALLPEYGEGMIAEALVGEYTIDGFRVQNPLGFTGRELSYSLDISFFRANDAEKLTSAFAIPNSFFLSHVGALARFIRRQSDKDTFAVLDIGGLHTQCAVVRKGILSSVTSLALGGGFFTQALSRVFSLPMEEAERLKREYSAGTLSVFLREKVQKVIRDVWPRFFEACAACVAPLEHDRSVRTLFLCGGGMLLPDCERLVQESSDFFPNGAVTVLPLGKTRTLPLRHGILAILADQDPLWLVKIPPAFRALRRLPMKG